MLRQTKNWPGRKKEENKVNVKIGKIKVVQKKTENLQKGWKRVRISRGKDERQNERKKKVIYAD